MATRESDFWNERAGPRIAPEHMGGILATAADIALVVGVNGRIHSVSVNPLNSGLGRLDHWEGRDIVEFLAPDSVAKVQREIAAVDKGQKSATQPIEVNHTDGAEWEAPIRYTLHATGREGRVLMLGRDLRPLAELQQRLIRAQMALERDYESQRVHETRFRALLSQTRDAVVLVDAGNGRVLEANLRAAEMLGTDLGSLQGAAFAQEVGSRRRAELIEALTSAGSGELGEPVELTAARTGDLIKIYPRVFRSAGERVVLCRLTTESAADVLQSVRDNRFEALFKRTADAIAFTDDSGQIIEANDAFLSLVDLDSHADLRGRSLPDFLTRGSIDMRVLTDRNGPRLYGTRVVSVFGTHVPVEIATTRLEAGFAFSFREADRLQPIRDTAAPQDAALENARSLVGSAPLRDIVASMTDEIEKECIEAAVDLTGNNRVAAAEMLGLSRQSLYVKLRKYNLLDRGE